MKLYRAFATVGGLTLVSRVFGFLRDILIAATLGSGAVADAFFVAFRFPNLFRRLFGEGAFNSAFVPLFAKQLEGEGKEAARTFAEEAMAGLVFVILALTVIAEIAMPFLMYGLAPGFSANPEKFDLAVLLTRITMPYLLCMSLVALLSGMLNSVGKFVESSAVSIVLNLTMMAATFVALGLGLRNEPLAGVLRLAVRAGLCSCGCWSTGAATICAQAAMAAHDGGVRRLIRLGIPGVVAGGVTQLNIVIGTVVASLQEARSRISTTPIASTSSRWPSSASPSAWCCCPTCRAICVPAITPPSWTARTAASSSPCCSPFRRRRRSPSCRPRSSRCCSSAVRSPRPTRRQRPTRSPSSRSACRRS
jgi:putative peptidoglycan lipid II flippase